MNRRDRLEALRRRLGLDGPDLPTTFIRWFLAPVWAEDGKRMPPRVSGACVSFRNSDKALWFEREALEPEDGFRRRVEDAAAEGVA